MLLLVAAGGLVGCPDTVVPLADAGASGGGENVDAGPHAPGQDGGPDVEARLLSLTLSPEAPSLPIGASVRMRALGSYDDGSSEQLASVVTWSSDAPAVADVGTSGAEIGLVTAYAPGTATIRAAYEGVEGSVVVTVLEREVVALALAPASLSLTAGDSVQLGATAIWDDDTSGDVSAQVQWSSSAPAVATVDDVGLVITHEEGAAVITASFGGHSATSELAVGPPVVVEVSAFNKHTAVRLSNGRVLAWGHNRYGQTGVDPGHTPAWCDDDSDCAADEGCDVNMGGKGVCGTSCLRSLDCGGGSACDCQEYDDAGACTKGWCVDFVRTPTEVPGLDGAVRVVTTGFATFAVLADGSAVGVGRNTGGLFLGNGDDDGRSIEVSAQPVMKRTADGGVERLYGITDLKGGLEHVVMLDEDGHVWSFGRGWVGQVGDGDTSNESAAVQITIPPPGGEGERVPLVADAIAAGSYHALAVERGTGRVLGWGWNGVGQLGDGTKVGPVTDPPDTPELDGQGYDEPICALASAGSACLTGATAVDAGWAHSVALVGTDVVAWGWNAYGQLGDGSTTDRYRVGAAVLSGVATLETGFSHVAALEADGDLQLWGRNRDGQLADGTTTDRLSPGPLNLPGTVAQLEGGSDHVIALLDDGRVYVWGRNHYCELGLFDRTMRDAPVLHESLSP